MTLTESTSKDSEVNTVLSKGASLNILDVYGAYVLARSEEQWGWVHKNYVFVHDESDNLISYGRIKASNLNVRQGPSLDQPIVSSLVQGDDVFIIKTSEGRDWYYVKNDITQGWIAADFASESFQTKKAKMSAIEKNVEISRGDERITPEQYIDSNEEVEVLDYQDGWYYIKKYDGTLVRLNQDEFHFNLDEPNSENEAIVEEAKKHLGKPYKWGSVGPSSFDCSGYTRYVFNKLGISLPRVSRDQATVGESVKREDIKVGDLVFFDTSGVMNNRITHSGIYIGNNEFIHASSSSTGRYVRISSMNKGFYKSRFVTARRVK